MAAIRKRLELSGAGFESWPSVLGVLAPDVEHEDAGDEQKGHDEDGNGTHFDSGRIVRVEPPHATGAGSSGPGRRRRRGGLALPNGARSGSGPR